MESVWFEGGLLSRELADIADVSHDVTDSDDESVDNTFDEMECELKSDVGDSDSDYD